MCFWASQHLSKILRLLPTTTAVFLTQSTTFSFPRCLSAKHSLCDERSGDRVFYQNRQGDHLTELDGRGVSGSAEGLIHGEPPGAAGYLLQELRLRGRGCQRDRERERDEKRAAE